MTAYGIENELTVQLADGLLLRLPFSFQHCEYDSFSTLDPDAAARRRSLRTAGATAARP